MSGIYLGPTTSFDTERFGIYPAVPESGGDFSLATRKKIRQDLHDQLDSQIQKILLILSKNLRV